LHAYHWPDPKDERIYARIHQCAAGWDRENQFLIGQHRDTLWEKAYMLVGMEDLMVFFKTEPAAVHDLFEHIIDFQLGIAHHYLEMGIELAQCGDDLGTQIGLLLSPRTIQEFLLPQYRRLFSFYRQNDVLLEFHSCGHIMPLLETFIDLGINILNPIQASANDLDELRRVTMGRMALHGGVSSALLVSGPPEGIENGVKERIHQLGKNGGYFCSPDQGMPWPVENETAFERALTLYGQYPLTG
jgi:uroporphyrinogen-III decarboxylase